MAERLFTPRRRQHHRRRGHKGPMDCRQRVLLHGPLRRSAVVATACVVHLSACPISHVCRTQDDFRKDLGRYVIARASEEAGDPAHSALTLGHCSAAPPNSTAGRSARLFAVGHCTTTSLAAAVARACAGLGGSGTAGGRYMATDACRRMRDTRNMTVKDIVLLVLGAILGAIVGQWYGRATEGVARRMRAGALRRRSGEGVAGSLSTKIVAYYRKNGLESSLYSPRMVGTGEPIALLFAPDLDFPRSVGIYSDSLFSCDHSFTRFPVSNRILRWYRRRGVRLFDGEFMWVMDVNIVARKLTNVRVGRFNFYAYATLCFRLQREMASRWRTPKMHDRFLRTFDSALGSELRPQAVGCMVATLLQGDDGLYIAIAKRSTEVLTKQNMRL